MTGLSAHFLHLWPCKLLQCLLNCLFCDKLDIVCFCRVTRLHCVYVSSQRRLTALGCQNGYVVVADVDVVNKGNRFIEDIEHFLLFLYSCSLICRKCLVLWSLFWSYCTSFWLDNSFSRLNAHSWNWQCLFAVVAVLRTHRLQHDSPITSVELFQVTERQVTVNHAGVQSILHHSAVDVHYLLIMAFCLCTGMQLLYNC